MLAGPKVGVNPGRERRGGPRAGPERGSQVGAALGRVWVTNSCRLAASLGWEDPGPRSSSGISSRVLSPPPRAHPSPSQESRPPGTRGPSV